MLLQRIPIAFWAFFLLGLFVYVLRSIDFFAAVPGDLIDARFNCVILEHLYRWTIGHENTLWSPPFFYPFENTLAFSDNHFGSAIIYIVLRWIGFEREMAFIGWFFIGNCLNFLAAYIALRRMGLASLGAAAGAFVFAFSLSVLFKEAHAQLIYRFAIPLAYAALWEFFSKKSLYYLAVAAFWVMVQFYCSIYLGVFLVYLLIAVIFSALFVFNGRNLLNQITAYNQSKNVNFYTVSIIILCALAVVWLLYHYYIVSIDYDFQRSHDQIAAMLPRWSSYLIADRSSLSSWIGLSFKNLPMRHEHQMFFGFGVWFISLCGIISLWRSHRYQNLGMVAFLSLLLLFMATLNVDGRSFYFVLTQVPGIASIRAVSRIILVMMLPVGILVGIGVERLYQLVTHASTIRKAALSAIIMIILGSEVLSYQPYNTPIRQWIARESALRSILPALLPIDSIIYVTKSAMPFALTELDGMIVAQRLGIPTLNGYSGNTPPGYLSPLPEHTPAQRLHAYAAYRHLPASALESIINRVVTVSLPPCEHETNISYITATQARGVELMISAVAITGQQIKADVVARNTTLMCLNTISAMGKPVRLSWRLVPISPLGERLAEPGWDARQDLTWTLAPGDSQSVLLSARLPGVPGEYLLEVSLVQEHVAWLHDLGMSVPSARITVNGVKPSSTHQR